MVIMDATIVNVALPTISHALHASVSWLQWIVAGCTLNFACLLITAGHLGDQFGEKKIFLMGVICFVCCWFACCLAVDKMNAHKVFMIAYICYYPLISI